jgi:diguanylate cyclase (GGDEF)-like protein
MKDEKLKSARLFQLAGTVTGMLLWLVATVFVLATYSLHEQEVLLALLPLVVIVGFLPIRFPLPTRWGSGNDNVNFTLIDAFVLILAGWYGISAAIMVAGLEGFTSSRRLVRRLSSNLFSLGMMSIAASAAGVALRGVLRYDTSGSVRSCGFSLLAIGFLTASIVQVSVNWGLLSTLLALRHDNSILREWKENFLCSAPMFLPTCAAASLMFFALQHDAFFMLAVSGPVLLAIYFGHQRHRTAAEQLVRAERERAEQAERHVQELDRYIAEQQRISRALEEAKEHFRHAAFHDSLTGLPNRAMFSELLRTELEVAKHRAGHLFAVLFIDLDRFKNINDSLGHAHGDLLLVAFAQRLEACLRTVDTLARFGGDEFAILLNGIKDAGDAVRVAERIQQELNDAFVLDKNSAFMTASIGIALSSAGYEQANDLLRDADTAMYRAKENGKARYELFDVAMHVHAVSRLRLENDLRRAVEDREFRVHYQPIVSLESGRLSGFEALVRWQHPERGLISPAEFIPVAEETGLIAAIGECVLEEACRQVRRWQTQSPAQRSLTLSVNLSGKQVAQPDLVDRIKRILLDTQLDACCLKLEITESVVMENAEAAANIFKQLRALGVQLSIDDFGTGYSSLTYLHRFPVNYLKIDRSFVSKMSDNDENFEIVRTVVMLARNLGLEVIAEGIETVEQLTRLKELKCEYGQGYLFSKPSDAESAAELLVKNVPWKIGPAASEKSSQEGNIEPPGQRSKPLLQVAA